MGQQQLLLIILGVIIVGIAIAVGITMFQTSAAESNRQAIISDCMNLGARAQRYFRTPTALAGGGQNFQGFFLTPGEADNANGTFNSTTTLPSAMTTVVAEADSISTSATTIYIEASGTETGNDGTNPAKVYVTVSGTAITTSILN